MRSTTAHHRTNRPRSTPPAALNRRKNIVFAKRTGELIENTENEARIPRESDVTPAISSPRDDTLKIHERSHFFSHNKLKTKAGHPKHSGFDWLRFNGFSIIEVIPLGS
jgi:hypothetical protein